MNQLLDQLLTAFVAVAAIVATTTAVTATAATITAATATAAATALAGLGSTSRFDGRVKALADAARESGLSF